MVIFCRILGGNSDVVTVDQSVS